MDRFTVASWLVVHALLALSWWATGRLYWTPGESHLLATAAGVGVLGAITVTLARRDVVRPPLPASALAAVSSAPRALLRAAVRGAVAGAAVVFVELVVRSSDLVADPAAWSLASMANLAAFLAFLGLNASGAVAGVALLEHVLLVLRPRRVLLVALALSPPTASAGMLVALIQLSWLQGGGWDAMQVGPMEQLPAQLLNVFWLALPVGCLLAVMTGCRVRAVDGRVTMVAVAAAMLVLVPVLFELTPANALRIGCLLVQVGLALPLAVRASDAIGPGWADPTSQVST